MPLDTRKPNLTEISNSADKLQVGNYLPSPDTNKQQIDISNKATPKLLLGMPPLPPPPPPTTTIMGVRK